MIGPPRKNGHPLDPRTDDAETYGLTRKTIYRHIRSAVWNSYPELAKRVIANEFIRHQKRIKDGTA